MFFATHIYFALAALFATVPHVIAGSLTYDTESLLLKGEPYQIRGRQTYPQRIPRAYWSNRLALARGMGLNTAFSYPFWDELEPGQGHFEFSGMNDMAAWYRQVHEAGLQAVIRPGLHFDGEHEWGGLPAWLSEVPGMAVRQNNRPFLDAAKSYIKALANKLNDSFIPQDGSLA
ncbi:hypothetical protein LTR17_026078 [Elasticomyces elasticus]|nr:hypothetical protein LTR17_026078 [Elasticomyces elasticus]